MKKYYERKVGGTWNIESYEFLYLEKEGVTNRQNHP